MKHSTRNIAFYLLVLTLLSCSQKKGIREQLHEIKGTYAVAFKDLQTGEEILINEHRLFHAASTMKTPVMIEVFKSLSLHDSIEVKTVFNSIVDGTFALTPEYDSEKTLYALKKTTVEDLVKKMIINSSNLATNILIEKVGAANVTRSMRDIGAKDIQVLRGVEDQKAFDAGLNNKVTAYDLMLVFESIVDKKEMIDILLQQEFNDIIPAKLPVEVKVAHKTGWITGVEHDGGIIFLPDGRKYVLVILSENVAKEDLANISKIFYDHVNP